MLRGLSPLSNPNISETLILGSMPSEASLLHQRYYAHPRNQFWFIMEHLFDISQHASYSSRCQQLIQNKIAVWDVLSQCIREGSLDSAIVTSSMLMNDMRSFILGHQKITRIFFNGRKAEQIFRRYVMEEITLIKPQITYYSLPSTSPANAALSIDDKLSSWKQLIESTACTKK